MRQRGILFLLFLRENYNVDDNIKKVLEVKENDRTNILETIADFKKVKDALKRE